MRQLQEENMTVQVKVESANRGGLLVKYGPYEGFVPVSQFGPVSAPSDSRGIPRTPETIFLVQQINPDTMDSMVGSELPVKFLEVDEVRFFMGSQLHYSTLEASMPVLTSIEPVIHRTRSAWFSVTRGLEDPPRPTCKGTRCVLFGMV